MEPERNTVLESITSVAQLGPIKQLKRSPQPKQPRAKTHQSYTQNARS